MQIPLICVDYLIYVRHSIYCLAFVRFIAWYGIVIEIYEKLCHSTTWNPHYLLASRTIAVAVNWHRGEYICRFFLDFWMDLSHMRWYLAHHSLVCTPHEWKAWFLKLPTRSSTCACIYLLISISYIAQSSANQLNAQWKEFIYFSDGPTQRALGHQFSCHWTNSDTIHLKAHAHQPHG